MNYVLFVDFNQEESNRKIYQSNFVFEKKRGPVINEEEPSIGIILDIYFPTDFME